MTLGGKLVTKKMTLVANYQEDEKNDEGYENGKQVRTVTKVRTLRDFVAYLHCVQGLHDSIHEQECNPADPHSPRFPTSQ